MRRSPPTLRAPLFLLAGLAGVAVAQQPPDAGALQQQFKGELPPALPALTAPAAPAAESAPAAPAKGGVTVTVTRFEFDGNTLLASDRLRAAVARYTDRPVTFDELQAAAAAVAAAYRDAGWVVRAFLPQQDLGGGVVRIQVVEAKFGDVRLQQADPAQKLHVRPDVLESTVRAAQKPGEPLSSRSVDRALLLLSDMPGVNARGSLAPGQAEGQTDVALRVANKPVFGGEARIDNEGSRSTGSTRALGNFSLASPTGVGDLANANLMATRGSAYGRLAYRRPFGYVGCYAGINASDMHYELVGADFAALDASGSATTVGLETGYPFIRAAQANLTLSAAPEHKHYDNVSGGVTTTRYDIDVLPLTLSGNHSDMFAGGGSFSGSLTYTYGNVDLSGSPNELADKLTTDTAGGFEKLRYQVTRQQKLGSRVVMKALLSGQFASRNLDSAEKFYLGGPNGIRAYPSSDGSGSDGSMLNLEFHTGLPYNVDAAVFYDVGQVHVNHDTDFITAQMPNHYSLKGGGLSFAWSHPKGFSVLATWARRIGDNPNATPAGKDQDGTLVRDRVWVEASQAF